MCTQNRVEKEKEERKEINDTIQEYNNSNKACLEHQNKGSPTQS